MAQRYAIAQVTPYPWEAAHEVNTYVARVSLQLARRGHRVLVLAPSRSTELVQASRQALRDARRDPQALLAAADNGEPHVLAVGEALSVAGGSGRARSGTLPITLARTVEELLGSVPLDFVHVHEPFAPSTSSVALRHSRALNIGTFHAPTEHLLMAQVARRFVELFFGRLDARTASFAATATLMARHFPADYPVILPGADAPAGASPQDRVGAAGAPVRIAFLEHEERAALRHLMRALRRMRPNGAWEAVVVSARGESSSIPLRAGLREHVSFSEPGEVDEGQLLASADVLVCATDGTAPAPGLLLRGLAAGAVAVATRIPVYEEVLGEGARGLLFEPRDADTLAAQLTRLIDDAALRARLRDAATELRARLTWERVADEVQERYDAVAARRHGPPPQAPAGGRRNRPLIDVDLHMHTDHSPDCATPVEVLLATAREQGLGAIAITDHNEVSGALEARAKAQGIKVIVAEEVKTASQGEVIGLFLSEKIPRGMSLQETVAEIKRQGGLVYVPHPFDRLHAVPDYEHLLPILDRVDAIEVFNPRVAIGAFNEEAARFAAKYRIPAGAGSDAHVAAGLGSVRIRMRDFDGPQEFMDSLREADIITRPTSLLYVQALKFIETRATPAPARRARRVRRVRRATRAS